VAEFDLQDKIKTENKLIKIIFFIRIKFIINYCKYTSILNL
jgi:hypothetical protein